MSRRACGVSHALRITSTGCDVATGRRLSRGAFHVLLILSPRDLCHTSSGTLARSPPRLRTVCFRHAMARLEAHDRHHPRASRPGSSRPRYPSLERMCGSLRGAGVSACIEPSGRSIGRLMLHSVDRMFRRHVASISTSRLENAASMRTAKARMRYRSGEAALASRGCCIRSRTCFAMCA